MCAKISNFRGKSLTGILQITVLWGPEAETGLIFDRAIGVAVAAVWLS